MYISTLNTSIRHPLAASLLQLAYSGASSLAQPMLLQQLVLGVELACWNHNAAMALDSLWKRPSSLRSHRHHSYPQ